MVWLCRYTPDLSPRPNSAVQGKILQYAAASGDFSPISQYIGSDMHIAQSTVCSTPFGEEVCPKLESEALRKANQFVHGHPKPVDAAMDSRAVRGPSSSDRPCVAMYLYSFVQPATDRGQTSYYDQHVSQVHQRIARKSTSDPATPSQ